MIKNIKYLLYSCAVIFTLSQCEGMKRGYTWGNINENSKHRCKAIAEHLEARELLPPTVDLVFKKIFGAEGNKDILINFLNSILKLPSDEQINSINLLNTEIPVESINEKLSRLDLLAQTDNGSYINIGIQVANKGDMVNRSLYYFSKIFSSSLGKNATYKDLRKVIMLNILNYNEFNDPDKGWWHFLLKEEEVNILGSDLLHICMLELPKYKIDVSSVSSMDIISKRARRSECHKCSARTYTFK